MTLTKMGTRKACSGTDISLCVLQISVVNVVLSVYYCYAFKELHLLESVCVFLACMGDGAAAAGSMAGVVLVKVRTELYTEWVTDWGCRGTFWERDRSLWLSKQHTLACSQSLDVLSCLQKRALCFQYKGSEPNSASHLKYQTPKFTILP